MRDKTEECMWCGAHEGSVELRGRLRVLNAREKFECVDRDACDKRVRSRIVRGARI